MKEGCLGGWAFMVPSMFAIPLGKTSELNMRVHLSPERRGFALLAN